jgi:hypothetical protein
MTMKRLVFVFWALSLIAAQTSYAQPEPYWTQVSMPVFFDYSATTQPQPAANGPYNFRFPGAGANLNDTSGCYYNQFASSSASPKRPYWFNNGVLASGVIPRTSPSVGTVFEDPVWVGTAMRGFSFLGSFTSGNYTPLYDHLLGVVFWSDEYCYDGTTEYGFSHDFQTNYTIFYFGSNQNCGSHCRVESTPDSAAANECSGGVTFPLNLQNHSLGNTFYYNAFVFQDNNDSVYKFKVELLDPQDFGPIYSCVIDPTKTTPNPFQYACSAAPAYSANTCSSFSAQPLYYNYGAITAGIDGGSSSTWVTGLQISTVKAAK